MLRHSRKIHKLVKMKKENSFNILSIAKDHIKRVLIDELVEMVLTTILQTTEIQEVIDKAMVEIEIPIKDGKETKDKEDNSNSMDIIVVMDLKGNMMPQVNKDLQNNIIM